MKVEELLRTLAQEKQGEVITSWKEIPIKVKLPIKWVSVEDRFVSFDIKGCKLRSFFTEHGEIYAKIKEFYFATKIFSNLRDELVLELESVVPPPPIVLREFVRVQPSEKEPVYVSFCVSDECVARAKAQDISETGIGVLLRKEEAERVISSLSELIQDAKRVHEPVEIEIELPDGSRIR
ncbi:MAG: hypothetical protein D6699_04965, partial [Aquificota bacterium]